MKFRYQARNKEGELQAGIVEAANQENAANILTSHDLFILSLENAEKEGVFEKISKSFRKVNPQDLTVFTRQFATLLDAEIPLDDSLRALNRQTKNPYLKEAIFDLSNDVNSGLALSQAMERRSDIFSEFYISIVRTAELTGQLGESLNFLADYLEKDLNNRNRIKNAMIYPALVIVLFLVVAGVMVTVVFPQLKPIFEESGTSLPAFTSFLLSTGDFLREWWYAILIVILLFVLLFREYFKTPEGKAVSQEIIFHLPVLGNLYKKIYITRFVSATSILIKGGVPIAQAIEIAAHNTDSAVYEEILVEAANNVRRGEALSSSLSRHEEYFPPLVSQMMAIGESTGRLQELLMKIFDFYSREVDDLISNLVELIQPILMVIIGGFVGLLFASVLMPIYNLSQVIQ